MFDSNCNISTVNANGNAIALNLGSGHKDVASALARYVKKEFKLSLEIVSIYISLK